MFDDIRHVFILHSIRHVPEVRAVGESVLGSRIRNVLIECLVCGQDRRELLYAQLVVAGDVNMLDFAEWE